MRSKKNPLQEVTQNRIDSSTETSRVGEAAASARPSTTEARLPAPIVILINATSMEIPPHGLFPAVAIGGVQRWGLDFGLKDGCRGPRWWGVGGAWRNTSAIHGKHGGQSVTNAQRVRRAREGGGGSFILWLSSSPR